MNVWNHASPNGIATNLDPVFGGIVDTNIVTGLWFFVANNESVQAQDGFETKAAAISALEEAAK